MNASSGLAAACLLGALAPWGSKVPTGPMADYHLHCTWAMDRSDAACGSLVAKLEALHWRSREEKLALHRARVALAGSRGDAPTREEQCAELRAIVASHRDYAEALSMLGSCAGDREEDVALQRRALAIEPGNVSALGAVLFWVHGADRGGYRDVGIDSATLAEYREALYEGAKARAAWRASVLPPEYGSRSIWTNLFAAADYIYAAAVRAGDLQAAEALQARVRRDVGLDALDYGVTGHCADRWMNDCVRGSRGDSLGIACHPLIYYLGMEDVCLSTVEKLAWEASAAGLATPDDVLAEAEYAVGQLRRRVMCGTRGDICIWTVDDLGWQATETADVARLRAVLEDHGGARSSEHLRVYAQGFLGDAERLDGLRAALRADPRNAAARCDLAHALAVRWGTEAVRGVPRDGGPEVGIDLERLHGAMRAEGRDASADGHVECLDHPQSAHGHGFSWGDRDHYLAVQERDWQRRHPGSPFPTR